MKADVRGSFARIGLAAALAVTLTGAGQRVDTARGEAGAQEVVRVENSFAQRTQSGQVGPAFAEYAGRQAIMFLPEPTTINGRTETIPWPGALVWRPDIVAIASSGDLAASAGPSVAVNAGTGERYGYYVTVWSREAAGWRFILDTGVDQPANLYSTAPVNADILVGRAREGSGFDLQRLEADFARDAARNARRAISGRMEDQGRVIRAGYAPAVGRRGAESLLQAQPETLTLRMRDGSAANSGDLAYAWGDASWTDANGAQTGHYVHVWRRDGTRWRLALDLLKPRPVAGAAVAPTPAAQAMPMTAPTATPGPAPAPAVPATPSAEPVDPPAPTAPMPAPTPTVPTTPVPQPTPSATPGR